MISPAHQALEEICDENAIARPEIEESSGKTTITFTFNDSLDKACKKFLYFIELNSKYRINVPSPQKCSSPKRPNPIDMTLNNQNDTTVSDVLSVIEEDEFNKSFISCLNEYHQKNTVGSDPPKYHQQECKGSIFVITCSYRGGFSLL